MSFIIDQSRCVKCAYCEFLCPFNAIVHTVENRTDIFTIDETVCRSCGLCAAYCTNLCISPSEGTRKKRRVYIDETKCIGCSLCQRACRFGAVSGVLKEKFSIDPDRCILCTLCAEKCKKDAIIVEYED